jgi:hypothetical protein
MPRVSRSKRFLRVCAAAAVLAMTGCGGLGLGSVSVGSNVETPPEENTPASPDAGAFEASKGYPVPSADSGADGGSAASPFLGSPLCGVTGTTCDPDSLACNFAVGDGSAGECKAYSVCKGSADVAQETAACRVVGMLPVCAEIGQQAEGMSCQKGSDCAAELECVGAGVSGTNSGICRRYCCDSICSKDSFCDIEPVFGSEQLVPVCNEVHHCTPLGASSCHGGQTCTVVEQASEETTACVTPGTALAGDDCTMQKCAADLACISGTCKTLCVMTSSCSYGESCMPLTALGDGVGICTK